MVNVQGRRGVRQPFCILHELGDVLDDGELHFVETAQTFEAARRRVEARAEFWPGQYVIYDQDTGESFFLTTEKAYARTLVR